MKIIVAYFVLLLFAISVFAQTTPPCELRYGTAEDENNIVLQMRYGSVAAAVEAVNQAKNSRSALLGCPQQALTYQPANKTEPSLSDILTIWNTNHKPVISSFSVSCPRIGRYENNAALAAYYAMQAGYFSDLSKLGAVADMMYDQQYATWNISSPNERNEGVFAYVNVPGSDACNIGGVVGAGVSTLCNTFPHYCVLYTGGQFAGETFATSGQDDVNNWFDGGFAYDHGWAGVQMIEAAIMQSDPLLKQKYRDSLVLAGQYAISEHSVKNHNYTAKLIWLLAELYAWTGDEIYKNELNNKLNKNLLPGILWDGDSDGNVDGVTPKIAFDDLTAIAQLPGRMWDGHNSIAWYQAMNSWAMTESYVAFRDRGDTLRANELKPYAIAMLDNLSHEILTLGVVSPDQLGVRDITYALLIGIWKISQYESEDHQIWNDAAWAMWNSGYFNTYSTHSVNIGLYLAIKSNTVYQPLAQRENFILGAENMRNSASALWYNPEQSGHGLSVYMLEDKRIVVIWYVYDNQGNPLWLIGIGSHDGSLATLSVNILNGGKFPPDFNAEDVVSENWGQFELEFSGCDSGSFKWIPNIDNGFNAGEMNIVRLINTSGLTCSETTTN